MKTIDNKVVIGNDKNILVSPTTYITKEEFITMITNLNFNFIQTAEIEFITRFKLDNEKDLCEPRGFTINIRGN